jgi:hypothetical protein
MFFYGSSKSRVSAAAGLMKEDGAETAIQRVGDGS